MTTPSVSIVIAGSGGAGAITAGAMLLEAAARAGWYAFMTRSSGPQIRGGEAAAMIRISTRPTASHDDTYHILAAVDWENIGRFAAEMPLSPDSVVLGDPKAGEVPEPITRSGARQFALPMQDLVKNMPGGRPNMVALGAIAAMIELPEQAMLDVLHKMIGHKGEEALNASAAAFRAGMGAATGFPHVGRLASDAAEPAQRWSITGNEAAGMGAIRGGVRFVAAYPITPATDALEWLAPALPKVGGTLVQAEDELASINQIIGASFGGTPSLTATSGPGLALMMESIGLAVAAEVPIVVVDVMRGGPSTGIPTKSEQSDLNIALYGVHGDAPHIVLAPTSISDCLFTTQWAAHLAETLQTAVIVLSDQQIGQARAVIQRPAEITLVSRRAIQEAAVENVPYKRYALTGSGVSPMAIPGTPGCQYTADGLEHNEAGTPSSQDADHRAQMDKRVNKLNQHDYGEHWADLEGDGDSAVIAWGSSVGPSREALERLARTGQRARLLAIRLLSPVQPEKLHRALEGVKRLLVVEQTHSGQFYRYLRAHYDLPSAVRTLHHPGPLPIRPGDVLNELLNWKRD